MEGVKAIGLNIVSIAAVMSSHLLFMIILRL